MMRLRTPASVTDDNTQPGPLTAEAETTITLYSLPVANLSTTPDPASGDAPLTVSFDASSLSSGMYIYKIEVNGSNRHPLYELLAGKGSPVPGVIGWNFTKFLVSRDGRILKRFESKVKPDSPEVTAAIEEALAAK